MAAAVQCVLLSVFLLSSVQTGAGECDGESATPQTVYTYYYSTSKGNSGHSVFCLKTQI